MIPVGVAAGQPGHLDAQHQADLTQPHRGDQPLEPGSRGGLSSSEQPKSSSITRTRSAGHPKRCARSTSSYCRFRLSVFSRTCVIVDCRTYTQASRRRCAGPILVSSAIGAVLDQHSPGRSSGPAASTPAPGCAPAAAPTAADTPLLPRQRQLCRRRYPDSSRLTSWSRWRGSSEVSLAHSSRNRRMRSATTRPTSTPPRCLEQVATVAVEHPQPTSLRPPSQPPRCRRRRTRPSRRPPPCPACRRGSTTTSLNTPCRRRNDNARNRSPHNVGRHRSRYLARQHRAKLLQSVARTVGVGKTVAARAALAGLDRSRHAVIYPIPPSGCAVSTTASSPPSAGSPDPSRHPGAAGRRRAGRRHAERGRTPVVVIEITDRD